MFSMCSELTPCARIPDTRIPQNAALFPPIFYPTFFLLQLNPKYMKRILHLVSVKNITFKSSYDWFRIDNRRLLRPLTAVLTCSWSSQQLYIHTIKLYTINYVHNASWQSAAGAADECQF